MKRKARDLDVSGDAGDLGGKLWLETVEALLDVARLGFGAVKVARIDQSFRLTSEFRVFE